MPSRWPPIRSSTRLLRIISVSSSSRSRGTWGTTTVTPQSRRLHSSRGKASPRTGSSTKKTRRARAQRDSRCCGRW
ncbi:hypothetical protein [Nannocystis pusilla]|uniref:hypothetical protein n=1 Tax=Nannocystis pusilla TaxID=889268 RepID=UPI003B82B49B